MAATRHPGIVGAFPFNRGSDRRRLSAVPEPRIPSLTTQQPTYCQCDESRRVRSNRYIALVSDLTGVPEVGPQVWPECSRAMRSALLNGMQPCPMSQPRRNAEFEALPWFALFAPKGTPRPTSR